MIVCSEVVSSTRLHSIRDMSLMKKFLDHSVYAKMLIKQFGAYIVETQQAILTPCNK